ncbi:uncharacterized protein N7473_004674 [Penicillium subrubescens]|uniref:uncharacterized protein n=1 Tax=Penicillium subrubescens TaxID=1316194 RepID=UPI0025458E4D|nr:uncharacterized protein N7473_004674 [Penicillium subrubescens]KAJ5900604.1 hypothetical protein N7473_004674 [Penicillium subrubescens]
MPPINITVEQLLDIEDALVSDENPARDDGVFDYERCARLHNYLVAYGWMALHGRDTPDLTALAEEKRFFSDEWNPDADRDILDPSLNAWLDRIYDPTHELFFWVGGLSMESCDETFQFDENDREDEEIARFIVIYRTSSNAYSQTMGVVYDQQLHRVSFPLTIGSTENIEPINEHEEMWFPFETLLTQWIHLIRLEDRPRHRAQEGLWSWLPYCDAQVDNTVTAIERYVVAVESRMPADSLMPTTGTLFTDEELDTASVPQECFIRLVLTRMKSPRFKFIAPGLQVPHDKDEFARRQSFTRISFDEGTIPAVLIFAAGQTVDLNMELERLFFFERHYEDVALTPGTPILTGLYSEPTFRSWFEPEEAGVRNRLWVTWPPSGRSGPTRSYLDLFALSNFILLTLSVHCSLSPTAGFRLVLPFALGNISHGDGARVSDGPIPPGTFAYLFQHGCHHPFGGEHRSQRMERLFDHWTELIESGVWKVGKEGVEGGIETFRDADSGAWRDYWIPPDW